MRERRAGAHPILTLCVFLLPWHLDDSYVQGLCAREMRTARLCARAVCKDFVGSRRDLIELQTRLIERAQYSIKRARYSIKWGEYSSKRAMSCIERCVSRCMHIRIVSCIRCSRFAVRVFTRTCA